MNTILFSSNSDNWETPQKFFDELSKRYDGFDIDVCASGKNTKCINYYSKEADGLKQVWMGKCWMNPPYGRMIGEWVRKAFQEGKKDGCLVVCLLPARTDTKWFHDYCVHGKIEFIRGRLKFSNSKNSAPFPSMIVTFGKGSK